MCYTDLVNTQQALILFERFRNLIFSDLFASDNFSEALAKFFFIGVVTTDRLEFSPVDLWFEVGS